jgi:glycosidase
MEMLLLLRLRLGKCLLPALALAWACGSSTHGTTPNTSGWWRGKVAYEIFVRSFSDSKGYGTGDLKGLTAKLDYLGGPGLGVDAVWLMPIFPSPSNHGYDVTDYRNVNPDYGSLADFDALASAAHARGIRVILDMVLDHSSDRHPWFVNSETGPTAQYRDWYVWSDTNLHWRRPWDGANVFYPANGAYYYGLFWSGMPNLNLANSAVEQEMIASMKFWLSHGADGFRLDAARYFFHSPQGDLADQPGTHAFLRRMRAALPDALFVAEAWTNTNTVSSYYGSGDEVQLAFSFDLADSIKNALVTGDATGVINTLATSEVVFPDRGFEAPFLSNHDQVRVMRALGADAAAMRLAAATLFALPGTPFLYYGEEIGMQGGAGNDDVNKRTAFHWNATPPGYGFTTGSPWAGSTEQPGTDAASQQADTSSLWNLYRRLIALRHSQAALGNGTAARATTTSGTPGLVALVRTNGTARVLFVANYGTASAGPFTVAASGTPAVLEAQGLSSPPTVSGGQLSFPGLAARSYAFVSL